ncbi:MAG TPA: hypothetical protein VMG12_24395 [Polyangiaceae bacterium]|nr:hypothetical protein [Polyangiaceae bacterium]
MARIPFTLALVTLLSSAPLVTAGVALAEPAGMPDRAGAEPAPATRSPSDRGPAGTGVTTTVHRTVPAPVPNVESSVPTTPMPLNLPDDAKASEVKGEYGIGIAGLIIGTVLVAALVVGVLFFISRRSWSTSH